MLCPFCASTSSKVIDKRDENNFNRRRRECLKCKSRFTTYEKVEFRPLLIRKKDKSMQPFDREKLKKGLLLSCEKRPISEEKIDQIIIQVETKLRSLSKHNQTTKQVGKLAMQELKNIDPIAYLRFTSVYQNFRSIKAFESEVQKLAK